MVAIIKAGRTHLPQLVPLFDQYREFYKQAPDRAGSEKFLSERMERGESVVFMAYLNTEPAGFTQLFRSFSSVSLQPLYILNDLFVAKAFRKNGIGALLLRKAQEYCRETRHKGLALETGVDNPAQLLYERLGWEKDSHCFHYFWQADNPLPGHREK